MPDRELPLGGYIPQSFVDYPGRIAAIVFTSGCNLRCRYCHNPGLVLPGKVEGGRMISFSAVFERIRLNRRFLDGVVVTGGEPTIHPSLPEALQDFRKLGLQIKLDTNGTNPGMLGQLISRGLVDTVAIDIKAPLEPFRYGEATGVRCSSAMIGHIRQSCQLIRSSGIEAVFRSTLVKGLHTPDDCRGMTAAAGGSLLLQRFRPGRTLGTIEDGVFSDEEFRAFTRMT